MTCVPFAPNRDKWTANGAMEHPAGANLRVSQSRADTGIRPPYAAQSSRFGANGTNALFKGGSSHECVHVREAEG